MRQLIAPIPSLYFNSHTKYIGHLLVLHDGTLLSCSADKSAKRWSPISGALLTNYVGHSKWLNCAAELSEGETIVTSSGDDTLRVWSLTTGDVLSILTVTWVICSLLRTADGSYLLCGRMDGFIEMRSPANNASTVVRFWEAHSACVSSMCEHSSGVIISAGYDGMLQLWDLKSTVERRIDTIIAHDLPIVNVITLKRSSNNGADLVSQDSNAVIKLWNLTTRECVRVMGGDFEMLSMQCSLVELPDNRESLLVNAIENVVRVWNVVSGKCVSMSTMDYTVSCLTVTKSGQLVLAGGQYDLSRMELRSLGNNLVSLCCEVVAKVFTRSDIKEVLPPDLYERCAVHYDYQDQEDFNWNWVWGSLSQRDTE